MDALFPARGPAASNFAGPTPSRQAAQHHHQQHARPRASVRDFGGSLEEVLSASQGSHEVEPTPQSWSPLPARRRAEASHASQWDAGLDESLQPNARRQRAHSSRFAEEERPHTGRSSWSPLPARNRAEASHASQWDASLDESLQTNARRQRAHSSRFAEEERPHTGRSSWSPLPARNRAEASHASQWDASLDESLQTNARRQRTHSSRFAEEEERPRTGQARPSRTASDEQHSWGGDLGTVRAQQHVHPPAPAAQQPAEPTAVPHAERHQRAQPVSLDEWGGGLSEVLQRRGAAEPMAARVVDAVAERRPRPAPPSVEEWGGGLGDVLPRRAETRAERAPSGRGGASTTRERREPPSRPSFSAADAAEPDYATLMQMHLRDNGPRATRKPADLTRHLKAVRAPPRNAEATCSICLDPLAASSASLSSSQRKAVCSLPCGHFFHRQCITETINHGHTCCPNCRFDLVTCAPAECPA